MLEREPPLDRHLERIHSLYHEIGVDESGRKRLDEMLLMLDELKRPDWEERAAIRGLWWAMNAVDKEILDKKLATDKPELRVKGQPER